MQPEVTQEHQWLAQLAGEWTFETEAIMEPGQEPIQCAGSESVRSLGGLWMLCEGHSQTPDGGLATTLMTLGYDPTRKKFTGTFVASMMTHLWLYEGTLDPSGKILTLDTEGPNFGPGGGMARYQDIIEVLSDRHRTLSSKMLGPDGAWHQFMVSHYRKKA